MGKYSLIQVFSEENGAISGVWLQHSVGSTIDAFKKARATEKANSNRIKVAVVPEVPGAPPHFNLRTGLIPITEDD